MHRSCRHNKYLSASPRGRPPVQCSLRSWRHHRRAWSSLQIRLPARSFVESSPRSDAGARSGSTRPVLVLVVRKVHESTCLRMRTPYSCCSLATSPRKLSTGIQTPQHHARGGNRPNGGRGGAAWAAATPRDLVAKLVHVWSCRCNDLAHSPRAMASFCWIMAKATRS